MTYTSIYKNRFADIPDSVNCHGMRYVIYLKEPRKRLKAVYMTDDLQAAKDFDMPGKDLYLCPIVARIDR